jgi:hypothetical protein
VRDDARGAAGGRRDRLDAEGYPGGGGAFLQVLDPSLHQFDLAADVRHSRSIERASFTLCARS